MRSHSRATRGAMLAVLLLPAVLSGGRPIYDCLRTGTRHFQSCCCQGSEKPAEPARPACCSKHAQPGNPATPAAPEPCGCCKVTIVVFNAPAAKDATPGHDTRAGSVCDMVLPLDGALFAAVDGTFDSIASTAPPRSRGAPVFLLHSSLII